MPQINLEYSANVGRTVRTHELMERVHDLVAGTLDTSIENCKSRVSVVNQYHVGAGGEEKGFVHLDVRVLSGRSEATKRELGEALLAHLVEYFDRPDGRPGLQITVEVQDIDRNAYFKHPPGTLGDGSN